MLLSKILYHLKNLGRICFFVLQIVLLAQACSGSDELITTTGSEVPEPEIIDTLSIKILSLGDSYTIGTGVCDTCSYPLQLQDSLTFVEAPIYQSSLEIIATNGWTTSDLLSAIESHNPDTDFDLVTLLIGVNNQFQGSPFQLYETEFSELVDTAITLAGGRKERLIVLSIPDYAFSSFGQNWGNPVTTSAQIDTYNAFAEGFCTAQGISFLNITDISREGLSRPELIADDGLHLSEIAYSEFVERLLPLVRAKLETD